MKKTIKIFKELRKKRLVALLSPKSTEECVAAYEIFQPEGVLLEIALRSEFSLDGIKAVLSRYPEALVLAGTVMTEAQALAAIEAGAQELQDEAVVTMCDDHCIDRHGKTQPFLRICSTNPIHTNTLVKILKPLGLDIETMVVTDFQPKEK